MIEKLWVNEQSVNGIQKRLAINEKLKTAILNNKTYLALPSPTTTQNTAQIKALTRQMNRLMRLRLVQPDVDE